MNYYNPYNLILELTGAKVPKKEAFKRSNPKKNLHKKKRAAKNVLNNLPPEQAAKIIKKLRKLLRKKNSENDPNKKVLIPETIDLIEKAKNAESGRMILEDDEINEDDLVLPNDYLEEEKIPDLEIPASKEDDDKKVIEQVKKLKSVDDYIDFYSKNFKKLINNPKFRSSVVSEAYKRGVIDNDAALKDLFGLTWLTGWEIDHTKKWIAEKEEKLKNLKGEEKKKLKKEIEELKAQIITWTDDFQTKFNKSVEKFKQTGKLSSITSEIARSKKDINKLTTDISKIEKNLNEKFGLKLDDLQKPIGELEEKLKLKLFKNKTAELLEKKILASPKTAQVFLNDLQLKVKSRSSPPKISKSKLPVEDFESLEGLKLEGLEITKKEEKEIQTEIQQEIEEFEKLYEAYENALSQIEYKDNVIKTQKYVIGLHIEENKDRIRDLEAPIKVTELEKELNEKEQDFKDYEKQIAANKILDLFNKNAKNKISNLFIKMLKNKGEVLSKKVANLEIEKLANTKKFKQSLTEIKKKYDLDKEEINKLKNSVNEYKNEINKKLIEGWEKLNLIVKQQKEDFEKDIKYLNSSLSTKEETIKEITEKTKNLNSENELLKNRINEIMTNNLNFKTENDNFKNSLKELEQRNDVLNSELWKLLISYEKNQKELEKQDTIKMNVLKSKNKESEELNKKINILEEEKKQIIAIHKIIKMLAKNYVKNVISLKDIENLTLSNNNKELNEKINEFSGKFELNETEKNKLTEEVNKLNWEKQQLETEKQQLETEKHNYINKYNDLEKELTLIKSLKDSSINEISKLGLRISELEAIEKHYNDAIGALRDNKKELNDEKQKSQTLKQNKETLDAQLEKLKKQGIEDKKTLDTEIKNLKEKIKELEDQIKAPPKKSIDLGSIDLITERDNLKNEVEKLKKEKSDLNFKIELLETKDQYKQEPGLISSIFYSSSDDKTKDEILNKYGELIKQQTIKEMNLTLKEEYDKLDDVIKEYIKEIEQKNKTIDSLNEIINNFKKNPESPIKERFQSVRVAHGVADFKPDISEFKTPERLAHTSDKKDIAEVVQEEEEEESKNEVEGETKTKKGRPQADDKYQSPTKEEFLNDTDRFSKSDLIQNDQFDNVGSNKSKDENYLKNIFLIDEESGKEKPPTGKKLTNYLNEKYKNLIIANIDGKNINLNSVKINKALDNVIIKKNPIKNDNIMDIHNEKSLDLGLLYCDLYFNFEKDYVKKAFNLLKTKKININADELLKATHDLFDHHFLYIIEDKKERTKQIINLIDRISSRSNKNSMLNLIDNEEKYQKLIKNIEK